MDKLRELLVSGPVLLDGGMGTQLMAAGLKAGEAAETWNESNPDKVKAVHVGYVRAGARGVYTNSFGGSPLKLAKQSLREKAGNLNRRAAEIAREAAPHVLVIGSMGPLGELLDPYGDLSEEDAAAAFREQAQVLVAAGVDGIAAETFTDPVEASLAVRAAREAFRQAEKGGIPGFVIGTFSFDGPEKQFKTMMGASPEKCAEVLLASGADAIGANCGSCIRELPEVTKRMRAFAPNAILVAKPNAGMPVQEKGRTVYPMGPEEFARVARRLIDSGVTVIGGCCGTTPEHIKAIKALL